MRKLVAVLSVVLPVARPSGTRPVAAPLAEPAPVARVRQAPRLSGAAEELAGAPTAVLPIPRPPARRSS